MFYKKKQKKHVAFCSFMSYNNKKMVLTKDFNQKVENTNFTDYRDNDKNQSETFLIEQAKQNKAHFEPLYNKYHEKIFRFVYQRLDDLDSAADITSQVFIKAMQNIQSYQHKGFPFSSWLYRIAINEMNDVFRKEKNKRTVNVDDVQLNNILDEIEEDVYEPYYNKLTQAISTLKKDDLFIIEMRFFEGLSFKEIGEVLDMTEGNARIKCFRIINRLKPRIKK